MLVGKQLL